MNTYNILQAEYSYSHTFKPAPPAKPFEVFEISWRVVGQTRALTINDALQYAKKAGWPSPAVEALVEAPPKPAQPQRDFFALAEAV